VARGMPLMAVDREGPRQDKKPRGRCDRGIGPGSAPLHVSVERQTSNTRVFVPARDGLLPSLTVTPQADRIMSAH
jgi:hypothetical protein